MRAARQIAAGLLLLALVSPVRAQTGDLVPDVDDPATAEEAERWLDATLRDLESGRKVAIPTPDGPLPYLIVERSVLTDARRLSALEGGSQSDALRWSANVLGEQRRLRTALDRTRADVAARSGAATPAAGGPSPTPRVAVVRGTPDSPPSATSDAAPDPPRTDPGSRASAPASADPSDPARATDPVELDPPTADPATLDPTGGDPNAAVASPDPALPPPSPPADPATATASPAAVPGAVGGGGGGVRGGRMPGAGTWALLGLGVIALLLGGALLVARRQPPTAPPAPPVGEAPRIDLTLDVSGAAGERSCRFRSAPVLVGRDPGTDLVLDDSLVSRRHARIVVAEGALWIEDLGSKAGLEVDGRRVDRAPLRRATAVRLGGTTLTVR